jgi:hypothetical protein
MDGVTKRLCRLNILPALSALLALLLVGCPSGPDAVTGTVQLSLAPEAGSRTIVPSIPAIASYEIGFDGPQVVDPLTITDASASIELVVGTWTITATGFDSSGKEIATGSESGVTVTENGTTAVAISLSALASGTGTINVTVSWPSTVTPAINAYSVSLDGAAVASGTVSTGTYAVSWTSSRAAGSYTLIFTLSSATGTRASVAESVQVFGNLETSGTIALTDGDFTLPPAAPTGLTVSEGLARTELAWSDNSNVEISYRVDRSTNQSTWTTIASGLAPNTSSYNDASAVSGTTYYYRVHAVNPQGSSTPAAASGSWAPPAPGGSGALSLGTITKSSVRVTWTAATDAVTSQSALSYRLYYATTDSISTVGLAQANGTAAGAWTTAAVTGIASGLSASTPYWFNVLVRDAAGNIGCYTTSSATTSPETGTLTLSITVSSPTDATITLSQSADVVVTQASTLTVSASESFDTYRWIVDGSTAGTGATLSQSCGSLSIGVHHLYLFVTRNGLLYSRGLRFTVKS